MTEKSQKEIFTEWLEKEVANGLKSFHYSVTHDFAKLSEEEQLRQINEVNIASKNAKPKTFNETPRPSNLFK